MAVKPMPEDDTSQCDPLIGARKRELASARWVWAEPGILGASGVVIFLTYLSIPAFTRVPLYAPERTTGTLAAERSFITRLVDLADDRDWHGGIDNPRVRQMVHDLADRHRAYAGMKREYLDVMAATIALAPLRVQAMMRIPIPAETRYSYWRYMQRAMAIFGCSLPDEGTAEADCDRYTAEHAGSSERGARLLHLIMTTYPQYAATSMPALFPACQATILGIIGSTHDPTDR
jgi:hypothetical protein